MLCRALFATVVLSYVLCVLLLSGVQKEDLDASTLRKLQRHNVNIDDINNKHLQEQCLGKMNLSITLTTLRTNPATDTIVTVAAIETPIETEKNVGSFAAYTTPLQKIVEYLENKHKEETRKEFEVQYNTKRPALELSSRTTPTSRDRSIKIEASSTEAPQAANTNNRSDKTNKADIKKELESLINIWKTNMDKISATTQQQSTTEIIIKDDTRLKKSDFEYITKIVAEIMNKQLKEIKPFTNSNPNLNSNETLRNSDQMSDHTKNETVLPTNYYLNNCKLGNFFANKGDKVKTDTFENLYQRLGYGVKLPVANTKNDGGYKGCINVGPKEKKTLLTDRIDDNTINYILTKFKKEGQSLNLVNNQGAKPFETTLENQPKIDTNNYKERFNLLLNNEHSKVLENELENRQIDCVKNSDIYKDKVNFSENVNTKILTNALENQLKIELLDRQSDHVKTTNANRNIQDNSRYIEENKRVWAKIFEDLRNTQEPKIEDVQTQAPNFRYKTSKPDDHITEEEFNRWPFLLPNLLNKQEIKVEFKKHSNKIMSDDHEKSTNIASSVQYDPNIINQYNRPWLYSEISKEQFRPNIEDKEEKMFFKPTGREKIHNTINPRLDHVYKKIWTPYFKSANKNTSITRPKERDTPKNNLEPILADPGSPPLIQRNDWKSSRELKDISKTHPKFYRWYQNMLEDRSNKQFKLEEDKNISQLRHYKVMQNNAESLLETEYKNNWAYFRNRPIKKSNQNIDHHTDEETVYFVNNDNTKHNSYQFPPRPYQEDVKKIDADVTKDHYESYISEEKLSDENKKKDNIKLPTFPPNVIKDIAKSVKEIVLRDLKTTTATTTTLKTTQLPTTTTTTTTPRTTTTTATTTTSTTTTATTSTTTSKTTTNPSTKSTTIEGTLTTVKDPLKIQDASIALEKIMEMFERINSMKDKTIKVDNPIRNEVTRYDTSTTVIKPRNTTRLDLEIPAHIKSDIRVPYDSQTLQIKTDNHVAYNPQAAQLKPENSLTYNPQTTQIKSENRLPYYPQNIQLKPENRLPYDPQNIQPIPENRLLYNAQNVQPKPENRLIFDPQMVQPKSENRLPYDPQNIQPKPENRLLYDPQNIQPKPENRLLYDPQIVQQKPENRLLYDPQNVQSNPENRFLYDPQIVQPKPENRLPYDPQNVQSKPENRFLYDPQIVQPKPENRLPYDPQNVQQKTENRLPYDPQNIQSKPETRLSYDPQNIQPKPEYRFPFSLQNEQLKPENRLTYNLQNVQLKPENPLSYDSQNIQPKPDNRFPFAPQNVQLTSVTRYAYIPQSVPLKPENRLTYDPQAIQLKPDNNIAYNLQTIHRKQEPNDYSAKSSYYQSKSVYDPYLNKEIRIVEHVTQKIKDKNARPQAIMVQTNSGEIAPLKITLRRPPVENIVLTTKVPVKEDSYSDETYNFRKPAPSSNRHKDNIVRESKDNIVRESHNGNTRDKNRQYSSRHTHKDAFVNMTKNRKMKKERSKLSEQYKPRDMQAIESFHEKLERGDTWLRHEDEKIAQRLQRPIVKKPNYDDTHFRNFLQTQQKVNAMLETILGTAKTKAASTEIK